MKKIFTLLTIMLVSFSIYSQTNGVLTVTVTTSEAGGNYAPKNILAIWVEDGAGNFVKTLMAYAQNRITHLNTWEDVTTNYGDPFNTVDAITGATRSNHDVRTCTWNGTDADGNLVVDGEYFVWIELTDKNSTGNYSTYQVFKNDTVNNGSYMDSPSFSSVTMDWVPDPSTVNGAFSNDVISFYPNPTSGKVYIEKDANDLVTILSVSGEIVYTGYSNEIDLSNKAAGIYLIKLNSKDEIKFGKIFKE